VTMVGIPARIAGRCTKGNEFLAYGLEGDLPDPLVRTIETLRQEMSQMKDRIAELEGERHEQVTLTKTGARS